MKVTTLACIQGAWTSSTAPKNALDIGAGTGLLSHMLAQQFDCNIDAVEIEPNAYTQLKDNIEKNPWKNKIKGHHEDVLHFANHNSKRYDFIISNPPFFTNHQKSYDTKINMARHENSLTLDALLSVCNLLLKEDGKASVLLPPHETTILEELCTKYALSISAQLIIFDSVNKPAKAVVSILSRESLNPTIEELVIKSKNNGYSTEFQLLLKDYYLYL